MALNLGGFSLDDLIDPMLRRVRDEWVPKQRWAVQLVAGPAIDALEQLPLDQYAEEGARRAMEAVRRLVDEWLNGDQATPLPMFLSARVNGEQVEELEAVGINPTLLFFGLQAALYLIEKLLPYIKPVAFNAVGADGATTYGDPPVVYAVCCDDSAIEAALAA